MRRLLTASVAVVAVLIGMLVGLGAPSSAAEGKCAKKNPQTGICEVWVEPSPPTPTNGPNPTNPPTGNTGDDGPACVFEGDPVECTGPEGVWSNEHNCYLKRMSPQPGPADAVWGTYGAEPGEGAIYWCANPWVGLLDPVWLANPPDGPGGPTPLEVAQGAIAQLRLKVIQVGIVPEPGPESLGIVGMPTWMWAENPSADTVGPTGRSASAAGITVTLDATLDRVEWDMGDGSTVVCEGENAKGTPYADHFGTNDSPTCGHRYEKTSWSQPGHTFTVTARSYWRVDWSGAGQSGTIWLDPLENSVDIRVGEAQVLTN